VLVDLPDAYRGAASYTLSVNHRCPPDVVRAASSLLAHNTVRVTKTIRPADAGSPEAPVALEVLGTSAGTGAVLVALIAGHPPADVAVLARVGSALLASQVALVDAGVPVRRHVGSEVLARTGLRTGLAYLRIAVDPDRITPDDLQDTLRRPARRLTGVLRPSDGPTSLAAIARRVATVDAEHREALRRYVADLALLVGLVRDGADSVRVLAAIRDAIGLGAAFDALDRSRVRPEGSSHGDDLDALSELALLAPDPRALPEWLAERLRTPVGTGPPTGSEGVALSTVHRVKGREWDVVVLVGMRAGLVPHRLCDDVEEERRVLHVAVTRARRRLVLVTDPTRPSPFLPELLGTVRPAAVATEDEAAVLAALRGWRRERAATDGVPAFLVAHDRTLADVARRRPRDRVALRACHGIGPARLDRYGDELLAVLRSREGTP
jgi:DNA helicase-2/ATP-dependent DNA helicase PcrA